MGPMLLPGDVLLFSRKGFFNLLIRGKTWSRFSHVEVAVGPARVFASRNGDGVGFYKPDLSGLAMVLRPSMPVDVEKAIQWARDSNVVGQPYDWVGLLNFMNARRVGRENGRMFCSEAAVRFLRRGGFDPFPRADADTISPRDFHVCPWLDTVWMSPEEQTKAEAV